MVVQVIHANLLICVASHAFLFVSNADVVN